MTAYPYCIVSYDEKMIIGEDMNLTILDGIIGGYLEKINVNKKINNYADYYKETLENLNPSLREDFVYDNIIIPVEVEAELEFNPISRLSWDYEVKVLDKGIKYKDIPMELPKLPDLSDAPFYSESFLEALEKRANNWKNIIKLGCTCEITLKNGEIISETTWIRNFDSINAISLCRNISKLIAFKKSEKLRKI